MFSSIRRYWKLRKLRNNLSVYVATLSPEKQQQANSLRDRLANATPEQSVNILHSEIAMLTNKQMKIAERLAAINIGK